jgi:hypothetical protein
MKADRILIATMAEPFDWAAWSADFDRRMAAFNETIARQKAELEQEQTDV